MIRAQRAWKVGVACLLLMSCAQTEPKPQALAVQPREGVRHSYDEARAQYELGRYYHGQRRYEQAIAAYRKALQIEPGRKDAEMAIGVAHAEKGDLERAREYLEHVVAADPESPNAHNNLGFVRYLTGDYPASVSAYKQALRLDVRHEKARHNLFRAMEAMGRGDDIARTEIMREPESPSVRPAQAEAAWVQVAYGIFELRTPSAPETADSRPRPGTAAKPFDGAGPDFELGKALEIANGNGVRGMATRVAGYFADRGVGRARVSNQRPFSVRRTHIEYGPGSASEAAALNRLLPVSVPQVASSGFRSDVRVRLVLGADFGDQVARLDGIRPLASAALSTTGRR